MKQAKLKKSLIFVALSIFAFSIFLNIFLYTQLRKYYTLLYAVELDPLGLSNYQSQQKPDQSLQTVVFFGDSRAAQWSSPTLGGFWFISRGIGNQTSAQVANRFKEHITPLQPDLIILEVGINDLKTIPLFPQKKQEIISNCKENILSIVEESLHINSLVVVSTIFPNGKVPLERKPVWSEDIEKAVVEVNNYIRTLATDKVFVFDAAKILSNGNGEIKEEYSLDELHLNEAGYQALNIELEKLLRAIKKAPN